MREGWDGMSDGDIQGLKDIEEKTEHEVVESRGAHEL